MIFVVDYCVNIDVPLLSITIIIILNVTKLIVFLFFALQSIKDKIEKSRKMVRDREHGEKLKMQLIELHNNNKGNFSFIYILLNDFRDFHLSVDSLDFIVLFYFCFLVYIIVFLDPFILFISFYLFIFFAILNYFFQLIVLVTSIMKI